MDKFTQPDTHIDGDTTGGTDSTVNNHQSDAEVASVSRVSNSDADLGQNFDRSSLQEGEDVKSDSLENKEYSLSNKFSEGQTVQRDNGQDVSDREMQENDEADAEESSKKSGISKQTFSDLAELEDHIRMHKKGELNCIYCGVTLESRSMLIDHMNTVHVSEEIYTCALCEVIFDQCRDLAIHSKCNHSFDGYRCGVCGKFYQIQSELEKHEDQHDSQHQRIRFDCILCDDSFTNTRKLSVHSKQVHFFPGFECSVCKLFFQVDGQFVRHRNTHTPYELSTFPEAASTSSSQDQGIANPDQTSSAPLGSAIEEQSSSLQSEEEEALVEDPEEGKPLQCVLCDEIFRLNRHLSVHSKHIHILVGFNCKICDTFFQIQSEFRDHETTHPELEAARSLIGTESNGLDEKQETTVQSEPMKNAAGGDLQVEPNGLSLSCDDVNDDVTASGVALQPQSENVESDERPSTSGGLKGLSSQRGASVDQDETSCSSSDTIEYSPVLSPAEFSEEIGSNEMDTMSALNHTEASATSTNLKCKEESGSDNKKEKILASNSVNTSNKSNSEKEESADEMKVDDESTQNESSLMELGKDDENSSLSVKKRKDMTEAEKLASRQCQTCEKTFKTRHALGRHMVTHSDDRPINCIFCPATFKKDRSIMVHLRETHSYMGFNCRVCGKYFVTELEMEQHESTHPKPVCHLCDKACENVEDLDVHMQGHDNSPRIYCLQNNCKKEFLTKSKLKQHIMESHTPLMQKVDIGDDVMIDVIVGKSVVKSAAKGDGLEVEPLECNVQDALTSLPELACQFCGKKYSDKRTLKKHIRNHTKDYPHICEYCDKGFDDENNLEFHERMHTRDFKCPTCSQDFVSILELKDHIHVVHKGLEIEVHTCGYCGKKFRNVRRYKSHVAEHTGTGTGRQFECTKCEKTFFYKYQLDNHIKIHDRSSETPFTCKYCGKGYRIKSALTHHEQYHFRVASHSCQHCQKKFFSENHKNLHEKKCGKPNGYQCSYCKECFKMAYQKESHEIRIHTGNYKECDRCDKKFCSTPSFRAHMKQHNDPTAYKCEICGKEFPYQGSYKQHLVLIHTEARPFTCSFCGRGFKLKKNVMTHENIHKGIKHKCKICGEEFKSRQIRNNHVQDEHTGRKYTCQVCGKGFTGRGPLQTHEIIHTGEKPFKCPHCDARFNRKHHVTQHLQRHFKGTA